MSPKKFYKKSIIKFAPVLAIFIALSLVIIPFVVNAATWTDQTASGAHTWYGMDMTPDGTKIYVADSDPSGNLYRSTDSGVTWGTISGAGVKQWRFISVSSNGQVILASEQSGDLWLSTNGGTSFVDQTTAGSRSWTSVAVSSDGNTLAAIANPGGFWLSTNGGGSWTNPTFMNAGTPNSLSMSYDGTKMVIGQFGGDIYTGVSPFANGNWTDQSGLGSAFWASVAISGDGTFIIGATKFGTGHLYTSPSPFSTWTERSGAGTGGTGQWQTVSASNDGSRLMAVAYGGDVITSINSGSSWTTQTSPGTNGAWRGSTGSSDGLLFAIGGTSTDIWTYGDPVISVPTVTSSAPSSLTPTSATMNGNITSTGNENPTTRGFHWGTTTSYGSTVSTSGSYSTGAFTGSLSGLTCNTTYHYEAFATNTAGTGVSTPDISFLTSACPVAPTVTTTASPTSITHGSAIAAGNITATGGENATSRYIEYGLTAGYGSQTATDSGSFSTGAFTEGIHGLMAGTTYHYRACAVNGGGTGCGSDQTFTTLAAPGAPTGLGATPSYGRVSLSWTAPGSIGGYAITDYLIEYKTTAGGTWYPFPHTASTTTSAIISGLTNSVSYDFRVSAVNAAGAGTATSTVASTPSATLAVALAPTALTGTSGSGQVALSWTAPVNDGGAAITDYTVEYKVATAGSWSVFSHSASSATARTVTGLTNGLGYNFRVSAVSSVGTSAVSNTFSGPAGTSTYFHILATGQSLAEGVNAGPALSTTQPYNNLSLSPNVDAGISLPLKPLVENTGINWESPASGLANSLRASDVSSRPIVYSIHAGGGQRYTSIKKGGTGGYYATGQTQASVTKGAVEALGAFYRPYAVTVVHGEQDSIDGLDSDTYAGYMQDMQADYESDWNALTGLSQSIPLFESQINTNALGNVAVGQLKAHKQNPGKVILVGPKYQLSYGIDRVHLTNTSSKLLGETFAKVMKKVLIDGQTWNPLMPKSVTRVGNIVTVSYHIPAGSLQIDHSIVAAHPNEGFEFTQTGGTTTISSVALVNSNTQVQITLSGVPDGTNPKLRYAWTCDAGAGNPIYSSCGDPTDSNYTGGNIRDTDSTVSPSSAGTGLPLYDWGVAFEEPIVAAGAPDAPTALAATPSSTQVALSWTAPTSDGGSAVTDYFIEYKTVAASSWSTFSHGASTATSATVTGLTNGTTYMFRVSAVNALGIGGPTSAVSSTPATVPGAPTSLGATGGIGQVSLTWTAPASNGGANITDYLVEYKASASPTWLTFADGVSDTNASIVTGLTGGTPYDFRVSAINIMGTGSVSSTASATPSAAPTAPGAPTGLGATAGNAQAVLAWTAPVSNGGSAITDYLVEYKASASPTWLTFTDAVSATTGATVTGLTNGTAYDFRVSTVNAIGTGTASSTATTTPVTVPDAPTALTATVGNLQIGLSWTAPADGGSALTDYIVEYKASASPTWLTFADGTSATASTTVTGLTNGTAYDFRVSAVNAVGTGAVSATTTATPATVPGAPTGLVANGGTGLAGLSWTAPVSNGGSAITDYLVEYKASASPTWLTFTDGVSAAPSTTVTGLAASTSYDFRVSAVNAAGTGTASGTATATTGAAVVVSSGGGNSGHARPLLTSNNAGVALGKTYVSPVDNVVKDCPAFVATIKLGSKTNDVAQVRLWQAFFNKHMKLSIPLTGFYGPMTFAAAKNFQTMYRSEVLTPSGLTQPTGYIYTATRLKANSIIGCQ